MNKQIEFKSLFTDTTTFQMEIHYASDTAQIDTSEPYSSTLTNPSGSSIDLDLPEDVLASGEQLEVTVYSLTKEAVESDKPLPSGKECADVFYDISFEKVSDESSVHTFDLPIVLDFFYTDDEISGIEESTLKAYRWDGAQWTVLSDSVVAPSLNMVRASSSNFSFFGVLGDPIAEEEVGSAGTVSSGAGGPISSSRKQETVKKTYSKGDLNEDGKIDLVDFTVALFWRDRSFTKEFSEKERRYLNGDGKIDLTDFSIIAFYWS